MQLSDFDFDLPTSLIAQHPPKERGNSRLLVAHPHQPLQDDQFCHLPQHLQSGDLLIFNNTKVIKARLHGKKESGGQIEALIERILSPHTALAHIRASKAPKAGNQLYFQGELHATMIQRHDDLFELEFHHRENLYELLEQHGNLPLPPYIERNPEDIDDSRYQTIYAKHQGAVAAPTAGLHFTQALLNELQHQHIHTAEITLHVGAGTFRPVRSENLAEHQMHREQYHIPEATIAAIQAAKERGNKIWAVGTTTMRTLEAAAHKGLPAGHDSTDIFITPGYRFQIIDGLITNFHLPKSTLLMLVSAFAGYEHIQAAYQHAIEQQYRFFSYGDAMLLTRV